ncbi:glycoside hydrolase family 43 protein [Marinihelvus fidelis]|uniref:Glycoside hydrolase family 43 protein n=1 Tax=Marinihelvus fidelis TaxID=2613842 RepID=A0A5N0TCE9_9GAMM|nr:glycoside hydrolase family 43 protein [Marinihelvus fidelis]KAA9132640.1 glycoside hydrolase family 43 protein [Marinihelvus fidelis]
MSEPKIRNPILPGFNPDPSIARVGDDFYIATSTFEWYPGVQIHHSRDLRNWRLAARPLNRTALLDMRGSPDSCGVWAPCLSHADGLFWLIYTDVKRHRGQNKDTPNYLTTCATIDGEWSDPVYMNSSGFDPSLFHDDNGRKWFVNMVWDHRPGHNPFGGVYLQEYDHDQRRLVGEITNIFRGTALGLTEAPHLYRRDDWYYLVTAEGGTGYNHAMTVARSRDIHGPYEVDPNGYLLTSKDDPDLPLQRSGHGDLFDTPSGETYLVHLCGRPLDGLRRCPLGRETALQKTVWSEDGWPRLEGAVGDGQPALEVPAPDLPQHPWPATPVRRDFDEPVLPMEFQWLRSPEPERFMSLDARPGHLRLTGKASPGSWFEQALVARRQDAFVYRAETRMDFAPENIHQLAGLVCYYNAGKFHYLYVSVDDQGRRYIDIWSVEGDRDGFAVFPLSDSEPDNPGNPEPRYRLPDKGPVWLRAMADHQVLRFSWSTDGEDWTEAPVKLNYSLISDEAGIGEGSSFTGAFVGMCCHDTSGQDCAADFDWFDYEALN